ncbi:MAG: carbon-nitrogen hydrolase family protein [Oscillospiraceae bacterium]|nr:carbon-nitrogen hydrolase family protein [Oscillospiraceae bacterium]
MEKTERIGRETKITSISFSQRPLDEFIDIVRDEAKKDCDLIVLPEACTGNDVIEPLCGDSVKRISEIAAQNSVYIVFPICRKTETIGRLNSSILIGRSGEIVGVYDKVYPFWEEFDLDPPASIGTEAPVFETDFGRVGMAICFDANFPEVFKRMSLGRAEIILWSSAYSAGMSLQAHAINHNYVIVTSTLCSDCIVYDITGQEVYYQKKNYGEVLINHLTVDLDRCIFHTNYNWDKREKLLKDYAGKIESDIYLERESWFTLRAVVPGVSARETAAKYGMEELTAYKNRSLVEIDKMRGFRFVN